MKSGLIPSGWKISAWCISNTCEARILSILERKDLIIRKEDIKDRRVKLVFLTDFGNSLKEESYQVILDTIDEALVGIKPSDLMIGKAVLQQIIANLTDCK